MNGMDRMETGDGREDRTRLDDPRPLTSTVSATLPQPFFPVTVALTLLLAPDPQTSPEPQQKRGKKRKAEKEHGRIERARAHVGSEVAFLGERCGERYGACAGIN